MTGDTAAVLIALGLVGVIWYYAERKNNVASSAAAYAAETAPGGQFAPGSYSEGLGQAGPTAAAARASAGAVSDPTSTGLNNQSGSYSTGDQ